ncbi:DsbA family oxidoreductase [Thermomonas sp.]|uniref:DsbA family oxidoreductase n=1 Tax=Thermomonas sp. TaxID=1971895 RepID=UPI002489CED1|nr:DsbA family oxidoreductase [Thermomonas sp.]MDI1253961.1 DsbA family oxidoreductase [Thermomonas sp.]
MNSPAHEPVPLRIDFVSDIVCPWCAIGLAALEQALQHVAGEVQAEIHFQPFELNPQMLAEGEDITEHLQKKYGLSEAQLAENQERIRARGAELGFTFGMGARTRTYNTFDAHRLLHWAGLEGEGKQAALKHALLRAYFTDGRNVSNHATLLDIAESVGLPAERAQTILASDEFAADVRADEDRYQRNGISAVPAVIINRRHLISGGQPVEVFERALRQIVQSGDA